MCLRSREGGAGGAAGGGTSEKSVTAASKLWVIQEKEAISSVRHTQRGSATGEKYQTYRDGHIQPALLNFIHQILPLFRTVQLDSSLSVHSTGKLLHSVSHILQVIGR